MASNTPYTPDINSDSADFVPSMGDYRTLQPFRYWCQKVLPLVYDESLSYYELLCKVVDYLNKTMEDVETLHGDVDNLHEAYRQLQGFTNTSIADLRTDYQNLIAYVNGYFESLDVQQEINAKLDAMALNGSLTALLSPYIPNAVATWLAEHITPTTPIVDDTLTISGAAADAKTVGDKFGELDDTVVNIENTVGIYIVPKSKGTIQTVSGESATPILTGFDLIAGHTYNYSIVYSSPSVKNTYLYLKHGDTVLDDFTIPINSSTANNNYIPTENLSNCSIAIQTVGSTVSYELQIVDTSHKTYIEQLTTDVTQLKNLSNYLNIGDALTWHDGYYNTDGTISTNLQFSTRYSDIIPANSFSKIIIYLGNHRQACITKFNKNTGAFIERTSWTQTYVEITNETDVAINIASTVANEALSLADLLSLITIFGDLKSILIRKWHGKKVAFVGDSITYGVNTSNGNIYYQLLNDDIGFSNVYADGIAGSCYSVSSNYGDSITPISQRWQNIPIDRDLIIIFAGTNDFGHNTPLGTIADTTDISFYGALSVVINGILQANPSGRLVLLTPLHRYGFTSGAYPNDTDENGVGCTLKDYVNAMKDIAEMYGVPIIDLFSTSCMNPRISAIKTNYVTDGLHPNAAGHHLLAARIEPLLETM